MRKPRERMKLMSHVLAEGGQESEPEPRFRSLVEPLSISLALALAVSFRSFEPVWRLGSGMLLLGLLTAAAYLAGYAVYRRSELRGVGRALLVAAFVSQPLLLTLLALDLTVSRIAVAYELILLFGCLAFAAMRVKTALRMSAALALAALAALPSLAGLATTGVPVDLLTTDDRYVFTSYVDLRVTSHSIFADDQQDGGALAPLPDGRILLVAGSGEARILDLDDGLEASWVDLRLPIDVAGYLASAPVPRRDYRVTDVLYDDGRLLASYTHWDSERDCYTLRLVEADFDGARTGSWSTRFESRPCLALSYLSNESGGRMAVLDPAHVLLTLGTFAIEDQGYDLLEKSDYGKILELDRTTWRSEVFTSGHRNPEGLLVSGDRIWSTEHGPQGGDELNLLQRGRTYGWPLESFGTDYGKKTLSLGSVPGGNPEFDAPLYSWLPGIAVSNLIEVSGGSFPTWNGDLLIASLDGLGNGRALFRVRLLEGRAVTVERIPIGMRVRDLVELPGGPLVLWDGRGVVEVVRPADHVFAQCVGCHAVSEVHHGIGPDLWGIIGSPVARHSDFAYSEAMRGYGGTWTMDRLDRFLAGPRDEIPGTTMDHDGVPDRAQRAEIIRFLTEISGGRQP